MELTLDLSGTHVTLAFLKETSDTVEVCRGFFKEFLDGRKSGDIQVTLGFAGETSHRFPISLKDRARILEQRLTGDRVASWLYETLSDKEKAIPLSEETIVSLCLGGLLLFEPETMKGRIFFLNPGPRRYQPLHRILWMYMAQVLGEQHRCFVHCAGLAKDGEAVLFFGDSGAGKSTLSRNCRDFWVFSDDSPIFSEHKGGFRVFPSPYHQLDLWGGLSQEIRGKNARVKAFCFLTWDKYLHMERVSRKLAISMILKRFIHFFYYLSPAATSALFDLFCDACDNLPVFYFHPGRTQDMGKIISNA